MKTFFLASLVLVTACASTAPQVPSNTSSRPQSAQPPSSKALVAHLRTASVVPARNLVCGADLTLGAFVSRMMDKKGVPPDTTCEWGSGSWHCLATFGPCAADPASDGVDEPRVWIEFDADASGALVGTSVGCGEGG